MGDEKTLDIDKIRTFWISEAKEAMSVAEHLVEKEDFSYALFFGHLALEKMLKAYCVKHTKSHAPPVHNLIRLADVANLELDDETVGKNAQKVLRLST